MSARPNIEILRSKQTGDNADSSNILTICTVLLCGEIRWRTGSCSMFNKKRVFQLIYRQNYHDLFREKKYSFIYGRFHTDLFCIFA